MHNVPTTYYLLLTTYYLLLYILHSRCTMYHAQAIPMQCSNAKVVPMRCTSIPTPCYSNVQAIHTPCYSNVQAIHTPCYRNVQATWSVYGATFTSNFTVSLDAQTFLSSFVSTSPPPPPPPGPKDDMVDLLEQAEEIQVPFTRWSMSIKDAEYRV